MGLVEDSVKFIQGIPTHALIFLVLTIILGEFFYATGNWTRETQFIVLGGLAVAGIMSMKEVKPKKDLEDAKAIALNWVKQKKQHGIIEYGTIRESVEGITRMRNGRPWYHEVCVTVENPVTTHYVIGVDLEGNIISTSSRKHWSVKDSPNVEIVTPPDFMAWYKLSKAAEKELEEAAR